MIATRTMAMLSAVALALLAGCAGEVQADPVLADKIAEADEVFKSRQYEEAGVLFGAIAAEALGEIQKSGMPNWDAEQWEQKQNRVAELEG